MIEEAGERKKKHSLGNYPFKYVTHNMHVQNRLKEGGGEHTLENKNFGTLYAILK